jgi:hypothetical protein
MDSDAEGVADGIVVDLQVDAGARRDPLARSRGGEDLVDPVERGALLPERNRELQQIAGSWRALWLGSHRSRRTTAPGSKATAARWWWRGLPEKSQGFSRGVAPVRYGGHAPILVSRSSAGVEHYSR